MECKICKTNEAGPNGYVCEKCLKEAVYQPKITILARDSGKHDWGVATIALSVLQVHDTIQYEDSTELAGVWAKTPAGDTVLFLEDFAEALRDRATLILAELDARREKGLPLTGPYKEKKKKLTGAKRGTKRPEVIPDQAEPNQGSAIAAEMQKLREKLRPKA